MTCYDSRHTPCYYIAGKQFPVREIFSEKISKKQAHELSGQIVIRL